MHIILLVTSTLVAAACGDTDDEPVENPNCTQVCDIMINDCDLASSDGPPGATVEDCVDGCLQMNGGDADEDMMSTVDGFTCAQWDAYLTAYEDPEPVNCMQVCDIMINDCSLASSNGPPGATVEECTEGCVEQNGNADISDAMMSSVAGNTCEDWVDYLTSQSPDDTDDTTDTDSSVETWPNCAAVCDVIINDCGLASDNGPPGATTEECTSGCAEQNGNVDVDASQVTAVEAMTCDQVALLIAD